MLFEIALQEHRISEASQECRGTPDAGLLEHSAPGVTRGTSGSALSALLSPDTIGTVAVDDRPTSRTWYAGVRRMWGVMMSQLSLLTGVLTLFALVTSECNAGVYVVHS